MALDRRTPLQAGLPLGHHRLIAEVDGWGVHRAQTEADRRREAHLGALGYTIQRSTRLQLIRHQREITSALIPFLKERGP